MLSVFPINSFICAPSARSLGNYLEAHIRAGHLPRRFRLSPRPSCTNGLCIQEQSRVHVLDDTSTRPDNHTLSTDPTVLFGQSSAPWRLGAILNSLHPMAGNGSSLIIWALYALYTLHYLFPASPSSFII